MAERLRFDAQRLQQFIKDSPWEDQVVWSVIRREVAPHLERIEAWIVDETGWPKQGKQSVGVSHQYCGALGKQANCQVSVEVVISDGLVAAPMAGRLYLSESWSEDRKRCREAGVPDEIEFATKSQIALDLIGELVRDEIDRAPVLGDSAYGDSHEFRQKLRGLNLEFFLQVTPSEHKGWLEVTRAICQLFRCDPIAVSLEFRHFNFLSAEFRNRMIFKAADETGAVESADFLGQKKVRKQSWGFSNGAMTRNYFEQEEHKIKPYVIRHLRKHQCVLVHCENGFKRVVLPPLEPTGEVASWYRWGWFR